MFLKFTKLFFFVSLWLVNEKTHMKHIILLPFFLFPFVVSGQVIQHRDANISRAVSEISVANLKQTIDDLVGFYTRNNLSSTTDPERGIGAAATYLYNKLAEFSRASSGRMSVEKIPLKATSIHWEGELNLVQIMATIRGTDSRIIALLAHYDSRATDRNDYTSFAPGANDNGSGVAALLEIARILSKQQLDATIKLMFTAAHEHGTIGARHLAEKARRENWNLIAVINNDMIGNAEACTTGTHNNTTVRIFSEGIPAVETEEQRQVRIFNFGENDSPSRQLARYIKEIGERYVDNMTVRLIYRNDRFGRGGDHSRFAQEGFTAVRITEMNENYDRTHQNVGERGGIFYGDLPSGIDFEYLRKNTAINLASVANLALAPYPPENVRLNISRLSNISEITWDAPTQGRAPKGYFVLIRQTDVSMWQRKIFVTDTHINLPLSRDNYIFAVQSVSEGGHEGIPVFVTARR